MVGGTVLHVFYPLMNFLTALLHLALLAVDLSQKQVSFDVVVVEVDRFLAVFLGVLQLVHQL